MPVLRSHFGSRHLAYAFVYRISDRAAKMVKWPSRGMIGPTMKGSVAVAVQKKALLKEMKKEVNEEVKEEATSSTTASSTTASSSNSMPPLPPFRRKTDPEKTFGCRRRAARKPLVLVPKKNKSGSKRASEQIAKLEGIGSCEEVVAQEAPAQVERNYNVVCV